MSAPAALGAPSNLVDMRIAAGDVAHVVRIPAHERGRVPEILERRVYEVPFEPDRSRPSVVLDVGANVGIYSLFAGLTWPGCRIHAFEPVPARAELAETNLRGVPGVRVHALSLSDHDGTSRMASGTISPPPDAIEAGHADPAPPLEVSVRNAASVLDELSLTYVDVLRIGARSCEVEILRGFGHRLRDVGFVVLEYRSESDRRRIDDLLTGFTLIGATVSRPGHGVLRYANQDRLPGLTDATSG